MRRTLRKTAILRTTVQLAVENGYGYASESAFGAPTVQTLSYLIDAELPHSDAVVSRQSSSESMPNPIIDA